MSTGDTGTDEPSGLNRTRRADVAHERGLEACDAGRFDDAIAAFREALAHGADPAKTWNNLGVALRATGHPEAAVACYRRALDADARSAESWSNLGNAYRQLGKPERAAACLRRAVECDPDEPDYWFGLGLIESAEGRREAALSSFAAALERDPRPRFRFHHGCALLAQGRYAEGWPGFEARYEMDDPPRRLDGPRWDGGDLGGGTVLIHAEQGLGDMIQFARFLPAAIARAGGQVLVEVDPRLVRLFAASFPRIPVHAIGDPLPAHDVHASLLSLPCILGLDDAAVGMHGAYLRAPDGDLPAVVDRRRPSLRVALTWSGNPRPRDRSIPFTSLLGLVERADIGFYSLQRGDAAADIRNCGAEDLVVDLAPTLADFADDARVLDQMDLVISIDTSLAHLAGALGKPVWTLLTRTSDWRFPPDTETSAWYPTMRLFRQRVDGRWDSVIEEVRQALADPAGRRPARARPSPI